MKHITQTIACFFILLFALPQSSNAQSFLNGSFEINTAGSDQINLANPTFNGFMSNTIAFGTFGNMDIISSSTYCGLAENGNWYTSLTGSGTDAITMQLSSPLVAGTTYTISFWDRGCWGSFSSSAPPVQLGVSTVSGATGTIFFTAGAPANGTWVNRTTTFVAPISGAFISVQLASGSTGDWTQIDDFTFVTSSLTPTANFTTPTTTFCANTCIPFTDLSTNSPTSWSWTFTGGTPATSTLQNPTNICYNTPGTYPVSLTVTNGAGSNTDTQVGYITVNPIDNAAFNYSSGTYCQTAANPTPTITGTAGGSFTSTPPGLSITPSTGTINLTGSTLGTYTVTYTTTGACPDTNTTSVTIVSSASAAFSYAGPYCQNGVDPSPTITAGATSGTFSSTAGLSITASTGVVDLSASTPGTYTVTNTVAAAGGCPAVTATATIIVNPVQSAAFNYSAASYCQSGTNPTPTITGVAGGIFTSTPAGLVFVSTTSGQINLAGSTAGTYTITYTTPGPCVGTSTATVTINAGSIPTFNYAGPYCQNAVNPSPTFTGGGVAGTFTSTVGLSITASTGVVNLATSTPGTYTVTNTIAASGACPAVTATATITINLVPVAAITGPTSVCEGGSITLTGSGGTTYSWSTGASSPAITLNPSTTTIYILTAISNGCSDTVHHTVIVAPPPINDINAQVCAGQTYILPSGNSVSAAGVYADTVITAGGCDSINLITLTVNTATAYAGTDTLIAYGTNVGLGATGGVSYTWTPSYGLSCTTCQSPVASPLETTTYYTTVTDANGCRATDTVIVFVEPLPCLGSAVDMKTLIPNAFSPNGDNLNDVLCIPENPCISSISLLIYDRWGEQVYESHSITQCWDGLYRGKELNAGVYAYYLKVTFTTGEQSTGKGNITLIK